MTAAYSPRRYDALRMDDRPRPAASPDSDPTFAADLAAQATPRDRPVPLRQMGIGELIDAAIKLYRHKWKLLIAIVALVLVPFHFVEAYMTRVIPGAFGEAPTVSPDAIDTAVVASIALGVAGFVLVQPFLVAAVARAATDLYLGEPVSVGSTYRFALPKIPAVLWISIIVALATMLGFILLVIPGIIVMVRTSFAWIALVVEGTRGTKAVRRSWRLSKGNFWRVLATLFLATLIGGILGAILSIPGEIVAGALGPQGWPVRALGNSFASIVTTPFITLVTVLLYFDLRIRKEGFDISVMAQELARPAWR